MGEGEGEAPLFTRVHARHVPPRVARQVQAFFLYIYTYSPRNRKRNVRLITWTPCVPKAQRNTAASEGQVRPSSGNGSLGPERREATHGGQPGRAAATNLHRAGRSGPRGRGRTRMPAGDRIMGRRCHSAIDRSVEAKAIDQA